MTAYTNPNSCLDSVQTDGTGLRTIETQLAEILKQMETGSHNPVERSPVKPKDTGCIDIKDESCEDVYKLMGVSTDFSGIDSCNNPTLKKLLRDYVPFRKLNDKIIELRRDDEIIQVDYKTGTIMGRYLLQKTDAEASENIADITEF
jgi:hypothetical protein